jgi:ribosomal-protein-alanine N-acetyltransferase
MALFVASVSIEPMLPGDMDAVLRIDRRCFPTPWMHGAYETELGNTAATYFVARSNGEVVGYSGIWVVADEAHITTLAVDPSHQRRRIGERLLLAMIEEAILRGGTHITLEVRESNRAAQNLYRKYGFREAALRKNYYTDSGENAVVMWADDIRTRDFRQRINELQQALHP